MDLVRFDTVVKGLSWGRTRRVMVWLLTDP